MAHTTRCTNCDKAIKPQEEIVFLDLHVDLYYTSAKVPDVESLGFRPFCQDCGKKTDKALVSA